jgi:hypothetical protein
MDKSKSQPHLPNGIQYPLQHDNLPISRKGWLGIVEFIIFIILFLISIIIPLYK